MSNKTPTSPAMSLLRAISNHHNGTLGHGARDPEGNKAMAEYLASLLEAQPRAGNGAARILSYQLKTQIK
jgi:hypothetical protein